MRWLDKAIERHGDAIMYVAIVLCAATFFAANWFAIHSVH